MAPGEDVLGEPLRARNVAFATVEDRFHQRVTARDDVADHPEVGREPQLLLAESFDQLDAERRELLAHRRVDIGIAAGDAIAGGAGNGGDAAHERAADAEDVKVLGQGREAGGKRPILVDDL